MWRRPQAATERGVGRLLAVAGLMLMLAAPRPLPAQPRVSTGEEPRIFAVLIDWTGHFIGDPSQARRLREGVRDRLEPLLFTNPSPLGFDPMRDRLFVARFGLVTDRTDISPLDDFLQVQIDIDQKEPSLRTFEGAFEVLTDMFRTKAGSRGAQWGFPSVVWTLAVDRIHRRARQLGLTFESIVLVQVTDDVPNFSGQSSGEASVCERVIRVYSPRDAERFDFFYELYTRELELRRFGPPIPPISDVGEDGEAMLRAFRIAPVVAGINLASVFDYDIESFSPRADGDFHGAVTLNLDQRPLSPGVLTELTVELQDLDRGRGYGPQAVSPDSKQQMVWSRLPPELGTKTQESRSYRLYAEGELRFPEVEALSQFRSKLPYQSPVEVEAEGLLELSDGTLLSADLMLPNETPKEARRRIDGGKAVRGQFRWAFYAVLGFIGTSIAFYLAFLYRPPSLCLVASEGKPVHLNWRAPEEILAAVPVSSITVENLRDRHGVYQDWTATLTVSEVRCDRDLVLDGGITLDELFTFEASGSPQTSRQIVGNERESVSLFLRGNRIEDLRSPGLPDDDEHGRFHGQLTITIAIASAKKVESSTGKLTVPIHFAAPRVRPRLGWARESALDKVYLYTRLRERPTEVRRLRLHHDSDRQALWPQEVELEVLDPDGEPLPGLELAVPGDALMEEQITVDAASLRIGRFGCRREVTIPVLYDARDLPPPTIRDAEVPLQLYRLTEGRKRPVGEATSVRVGLSNRGPHPIIRLEAFKNREVVRIVDYPTQEEPAPQAFEFQPVYPLVPADDTVADPWIQLATLELANRAERTTAGGEVSFKLGDVEVHSQLAPLGLTAEEFVACLRLVEKSERERESSRAVNHLGSDDPFGTLAPGPNASATYQLELDQNGFDRLKVESGTVEFTIHFEGWLMERRPAHFAKRFRLPLVADYGDRWFLMDMGTSTIVAAVMTVGGDLQLLDLVETEAPESLSSDGHDTKFLPSTLFIRRPERPPVPPSEETRGAPPGETQSSYLLVFEENPEDLAARDIGRLLPPFKLLVGSKHLPLNRTELEDLNLDERPKVDEVLKQAIKTLVEEKVLPALSRAEDAADRKLPTQVLLTIPNSFTPAHTEVIRSLFETELGARRVTFLSESDAICWHYLTRVENGEEDAERFHHGLEHVLVIDVGAGTTDLTYVGIERRGSGKVERATILHRDGFRLAGNNVDTLFGRVLHHKLASLNDITDSPYIYKAEEQIFLPDDADNGHLRLTERALYPIVRNLRHLKTKLASYRDEMLSLRFDREFLIHPGPAGSDEAHERLSSWLRTGVGEGQRKNEVRFQRSDLLHAPAYSRLVHRDMSTEILRHFFAGCPETWESAPPAWSRDGRFPVDTLILTGRGSLTPGLRKALEEALDEHRLDPTEPVGQPSFSRTGTPDQLKLAVIQGSCDYIGKFGPDSGEDNSDRVRDRGLHENYYLFTGPGTSFSACYKLLDREKHGEGQLADAGGSKLRRFQNRLKVPFFDANGAVLVVSTSSRRAPVNPQDPDAPIRPLCQFRQKNLNREVEIYFEVDSNRDYQLRIDSTDFKGREHRYDSELLELGPGVRENLWPGRPCEPDEPRHYYTSRLPRAVVRVPATAEPKSALARPPSEPETLVPGAAVPPSKPPTTEPAIETLGEPDVETLKELSPADGGAEPEASTKPVAAHPAASAVLEPPDLSSELEMPVPPDEPKDPTTPSKPRPITAFPDFDG